MTSLLTVLLLVGSLGNSQTEDGNQEYYREVEWSVWMGKLRGFDEIQMTLAYRTAPDPVKWSKEGIEFETRIFHDIPLFELHVADGGSDFLRLLEFKPRTEKTSDWCYGLFNLYFFRTGEKLGSLHYSHGCYWAPLTKRSQEAVTKWLVDHGFPVKDLIQKDEANYAPDPTALAVTPAADAPVAPAIGRGSS